MKTDSALARQKLRELATKKAEYKQREQKMYGGWLSRGRVEDPKATSSPPSTSTEAMPSPSSQTTSIPHPEKTSPPLPSPTVDVPEVSQDRTESVSQAAIVDAQRNRLWVPNLLVAILVPLIAAFVFHMFGPSDQ